MAKKIGIFVGSLRKESFNKKLAENIIKMFPSSYETELVSINNISLYNQDLDDTNPPPKSWVDFREKVGEFEGAIFLTPEYNRSIPAALKNALDVASRPYGYNKWNGKPAAIISSSIGGLSGFGANHHLRQVLAYLNMPTMPQPEAYIGEVHKLFDSDGNIADEGTTKFLQSFVDSYVAWADKF